MSVVITSDRLQGFAINLSGYIRNFYGMLDDMRIAPATGLPDWDISTNQNEEQLRMFFDWLINTQKAWSGFGRQWKYHFFPTNLRAGLKEDWLPPVQYTLIYAEKYALPQYPQTRVRIADPTDRFGKTRSIRTHPAEKSEKR